MSKSRIKQAIINASNLVVRINAIDRPVVASLLYKRRSPKGFVTKNSMLYILLPFALIACQTAKTFSTTAAVAPVCEDQLADLPDFKNQFLIVEKTKQAGGYVLSYGATAAGYAADAVVYVTEGVVKTVIYCPVFVVSLAMGLIPPHYCEPKNPNDKLIGIQLGKGIYRNTEEFRKVDYVPLSQSIRKTSRCFASRGDSGSIEKAKSQLDALKISDLFSQLPEQEQHDIDTDMERLNAGQNHL